MIVLDTNVVSETMKPDPDLNVVDWLDRQAAETLYLTSVTIAELLFGVAAMPTGRRKGRLAHTVSGLIELYAGRVLPFDLDAARQHATLAVNAKRGGHGLPVPDGYIAAIAASHGFAIATRDHRPFEKAGLRVIDPWTA